jgi:hypothetical protein
MAYLGFVTPRTGRGDSVRSLFPLIRRYLVHRRRRQAGTRRLSIYDRGDRGSSHVPLKLGRSSNQNGAIGMAVHSRYTQSRLQVGCPIAFRISVSSRRCLPLFSPRDQLIIDVFLLLALPRGDPRWTQLGRCNGPISEYLPCKVSQSERDLAWLTPLLECWTSIDCRLDLDFRGTSDSTCTTILIFTTI